jgi:hypothetical protein
VSAGGHRALSPMTCSGCSSVSMKSNRPWTSRLSCGKPAEPVSPGFDHEFCGRAKDFCKSLRRLANTFRSNGPHLNGAGARRACRGRRIVKKRQQEYNK